MAVYPHVSFFTEHYRNQAWLSMRLPAATPVLVTEALAQAWRLAAPKLLLKKAQAAGEA